MRNYFAPLTFRVLLEGLGIFGLIGRVMGVLVSHVAGSIRWIKAMVIGVRQALHTSKRQYRAKIGVCATR